MRGDWCPYVSVILPALNEEKHLSKALTALDNQDYPNDRYEIIVVDNGSTDGTREVAKELGGRVLVDAVATVGGLRNLGHSVASGEVLAFIDADCVAPQDWISNGIAVLGTTGVGAVGGSCLAPREGSWVEKAWAGRVKDGTCAVAALASSSLIVKRRAFEEVGGFDPRLKAGEDDDLSNRLRGAGYSLLSTRGCAVVHMGYPSNVWAIVRRQTWHGRSHLRVTGGKLDRLLILTHAFAVTIVLAIVFMFVGWHGFVPSGLFVLSGFALALFAAFNRGPRGFRHGIQLTVIYWFFLLGRAVGLTLSYLDHLRQIRQRSRSNTLEADE